LHNSIEMNRFASIVQVSKLKKITYYSVHFDDKQVNEFEDFINKHANDSEIEEEYADLIGWIYKLGEDVGALRHYFRPEKRADALPPPAKFIEIDYTENLRLYCMRISKSIVILFNGGIKTTNTAQQCPNVRPCFNLANKLAHAIDELIYEKYIKVDDDKQALIIEEGIDIIL